MIVDVFLCPVRYCFLFGPLHFQTDFGLEPLICLVCQAAEAGSGLTTQHDCVKWMSYWLQMMVSSAVPIIWIGLGHGRGRGKGNLWANMSSGPALPPNHSCWLYRCNQVVLITCECLHVQMLRLESTLLSLRHCKAAKKMLASFCVSYGDSQMEGQLKVASPTNPVGSCSAPWWAGSLDNTRQHYASLLEATVG